MDAEAALIAQLAPAVGRHALPLFFALLALALAFAWIGWWAFERWLRPREVAAAPAPALLMLRLALGFGAVVLGASLFAVLAEQLHPQAALGAADQAVADAVRDHVPRSALRVFAVLTRLGDTLTITGLCIVVALWLVLRRRPWLALGWVAAVGGNALLNITLKQVFARVRPLHDDGLVMAQGFSFPSGHSSGAVVAFGMLAYVAMRFVPRPWHLALALTAVTLAFSIGASRMFLRVHFASDVIAGFASGSVWLAVCVASIEVTRWFRGRGRGPGQPVTG